MNIASQSMTVGEPHGAYHGFVVRSSQYPALYQSGVGKIAWCGGTSDHITQHAASGPLLGFREAMQRAEITAIEKDAETMKLPKDPWGMSA
jgi:hypothetical protein